MTKIKNSDLLVGELYKLENLVVVQRPFVGICLIANHDTHMAKFLVKGKIRGIFPVLYKITKLSSNEEKIVNKKI